jgi:hypothetical protein
VAVEPVKLPMWRRIWLLRGRLRRLYLGVIRPGYVRRSHARRTGECVRCGICCQMGFRCPSLETHEALAGCTKYQKRRPINCRNFPIDERCLADRDQVAPHHPCGYRFTR